MSSTLANEPEILTVEDVCRILQVKRSWCYNDTSLPWFHAGRLKRIKRVELARYIDGNSLCDAQTIEINSKYEDPMDFTRRDLPEQKKRMRPITSYATWFISRLVASFKANITRCKESTLQSIAWEFCR